MRTGDTIGGLRFHTQEFNSASTRLNVALLFLATFASAWCIGLLMLMIYGILGTTLYVLPPAH